MILLEKGTVQVTTKRSSRSTGSTWACMVNDESEERKQKERRLVKKLDICLLPVLVLMCLFQAIDKGSLGIAKISGLEADLRMTQTQFNVAISIFQVGFMCLQVPSNLLITKVRPQIYLSCCCAAWSIVAACHSVVSNYGQLLVIRILLGLCDAPFFVGAIHLLSCWYTRRELAKRTSIILGTLIVTMTFLYPIAAGVMIALEGVNGWLGWRWLYLIFGCAGIFVAGLGFVMIPNYPEGTGRPFWLSIEEQELGRIRIAEDRVDEKVVERNRLRTGFKDACRDVRTWVFILMFMSRKSLEGLYYYLPTIFLSAMQTLAADSKLSAQSLALLLGSPPSLVAAALAFGLAYTSDRFSERAFHIAIPLFMALIGLIMSIATMDTVIRYASVYLYLAGSIVGSGMSWAWVANVLQETPEKKAIAISLVNVLGGLGSIWAPFFFRVQDAPAYRLAFGMIIGFVTIDISCVFVMRWILQRQNKRILKIAAEYEVRQQKLQTYVL